MTPNADTSFVVDLSSLASRLAQPRRPRLGDARAAVAHASSGPEAWRSLFNAGLVPPALYQSADRRFALVNTERSPLAVDPGPAGLHAAPQTVEVAVTIASDVDGVLEAERLTRLLRTRLVPWGAKEAEQIDWIILTHQVQFPFEQGLVFNCAMYSLEYALGEAGIEIAARRDETAWLPPFVQSAVRAQEGWSVAVAESLEIPAAYGAPRQIVDTPFASLENPFQVALELWSHGYVLDHLCYENLPSARLFTCVVDAPQNLLRRLRDKAAERG